MVKPNVFGIDTLLQFISAMMSYAQTICMPCVIDSQHDSIYSVIIVQA